ncbi:MAG: helix-turn-helix domain-containing protein [Ruminococcaceae bacterium]|nr:helix-turn-helix domain-containing protein [Oscillospiraceae bacterium]
MADRIYEMPGKLTSNYACPDHSSMLHRHTVDELIIMDSGGSEIIANDGIYHIKAPCAIFYPRYQPHQQIHTSDELYSRYAIAYDCEIIGGIIPPNCLPRAFFAISLTPEELNELAPILALMPECAKSEQEIIRYRYLLAIVLQRLEPLWRTRFMVGSETHLAGDKYIHDICHYINEHYAEPLTLDSIANQFFISRAKLVRLFRSVLNLSPNQFITNVRIHAAKVYLRHGNSVQQTAYLTGFGSASYFIKIFRRHTGMTPEEFKNRQ